MTSQRWNGTSFVSTSIAQRWNGTAWVNITVAKRWDGSTWVDLGLVGAGSLSVVLDKAYAFGTSISNALTKSVTSTMVNATATGGSPGYTYAWTQVSGSSAIQPDSPNSPSTTFTANVSRDQTIDAVYMLTVTDSLGATTTINVNVALTHDSTGGGV